MARFYRTGTTDFVDYETDQRPGAVDVSSIFGKLQALPEDRARLQELVGEFDTQINALASQLQKNPSSVRRLAPQISQLRTGLRDSLQFGEIAAIQDRLKSYQGIQKGIGETFKNDPFLADQATKRIQVSDLSYNPETRSYGKITAPDVVKPFTAEDKRKFRETAENTLKDRILSSVKDRDKLNATTDLLRIGEMVGVSRDQVIDSLIGQVTPEMIRAEQQDLRFRGMDKEAEKAANFFDEKTRTFDKSTTYGAMLASMVEALSRTNFKGQNIQVKDDAAKAAIQANKELKVAKGKKRLDKEDEAKIIAQKLQAVWRSNDKAFQGLSGDKTRKVDNWLEGLTTEDDRPIIGIEKPIGGQPVVLVQELDAAGNPAFDIVTDENGNTTQVPKTRQQYLDMDFVQSQFGTQTADLVKEFLGEDYDPERANIAIDATQDLEGAGPVGPYEYRKGAGETDSDVLKRQGRTQSGQPKLKGIDYLYE